MTLLDRYRLLLTEIDSWFSRCQQQYPEEIACSKGCSECCRGLFDITILDAAMLSSGFEHLPGAVRERVNKLTAERLLVIRSSWPEFRHPFTLNHRPEEEIETLMASDNETPCVLLDAEGKCLLYDYRPMTCRLHGLPLTDVSGEVMESEYCTKNFSGSDPLKLKNLRGEFDRLLREEATLGRRFIAELTGKSLDELDTFIATALLIDFKKFG